MATAEAELVRASLDGDPHAFEEVVRRYQRLVFNIIYHYLGRRNEVEDVAQEVFLKAYRSLSTYDTSRPLKAWISRIAVNACIDELRRARKKKMMLFSELTDDERGSLDHFHDRFLQGGGLSETEADRMLKLLQRLVSGLADKDRMAFVLRELEGLEYSEIAAAMGTSEVAARIRVSRSKKQLLELLAHNRPQTGKDS